MKVCGVVWECYDVVCGGHCVIAVEAAMVLMVLLRCWCCWGLLCMVMGMTIRRQDKERKARN